MSNFAEFKAAVENGSITKIVVTGDIDVPCVTADKSAKTTIQLNINRSLTIESESGHKYTIKRVAVSGANTSSLVSVFGIQGNGSGGGFTNVSTNTVNVSLRNIIVDGGAGLAVVDDNASGDDVQSFKGGYITGGNGVNHGGGIIVSGNGYLTMNGGIIIGNKTALQGGGILFGNEAAVFVCQ